MFFIFCLYFNIQSLLKSKRDLVV